MRQGWWFALGAALVATVTATATVSSAATKVTAPAPVRSVHTNYILRCAGCHGVDGEGLPSAGVPSFPGFVGVFAGDDDGRTYLLHVPGVVGSSLTNAEIAGVLNYIMMTWAGDSLPEGYVPFTEEEVTRRRAIDIGNVALFRHVVVEKLAAMGLVAADYPWP